MHSRVEIQFSLSNNTNLNGLSLTEQEYQLLNWARIVARFDKQELSLHFKKISKTAKKQLSSIPVINSQPPSSQHQIEQLSPTITESPTCIDPVPILTHVPNRTIRNRREAFNYSEDEEYQPRVRPRRVIDRAVPTAAVVIYAEHQKIKDFLIAYAPIKKWQRYPETNVTSFQRHAVQYETAQMIELSNLQDIEMDELITKFYIDIKDSLTLALECESRAALHHFNVGLKLAILHDRLQNDIPRLKNILKEGLSMSLR